MFHPNPHLRYPLQDLSSGALISSLAPLYMSPLLQLKLHSLTLSSHIPSTLFANFYCSPHTCPHADWKHYTTSLTQSPPLSQSAATKPSQHLLSHLDRTLTYSTYTLTIRTPPFTQYLCYHGSLQTLPSPQQILHNICHLTSTETLTNSTCTSTTTIHPIYSFHPVCYHLSR